MQAPIPASRAKDRTAPRSAVVSTGRVVVRALALAGASLALAGCASAPPPTVMAATIQATAGVNPDIHNRASPIVVRVYQLRSADAFDSADFLALFEHDQATLATDLVAREEMTLRPGESRALDAKLAPDVKVVAIFAGYRDLEASVWRANLLVTPGVRNAFTFKLQPKAIEATKSR